VAYESLVDFVKALDDAGELSRVEAEVSWDLEITEVTDRVCKRGGPALVFLRVSGYRTPVLTNALGSRRRMAMALGVSDVEEIAQRIEDMVRRAPPDGLLDKVKTLSEMFRLGQFFPRRVRGGRCKEVIKRGDEVDLLAMPVLRCWPGDGGRFITLPLVVTSDPDTGTRNVGMYRMQVYDRNTTGMHWHVHKTGAEHFRKYRARGERMPVAVAIGADPATIYSATAPLPPSLDELVFAGFLRSRSVETVRCETCDLEVPAWAEYVLEGYVDPGELRREGPFGDHTGYYSLADDYPVFHVTCITHARDPIYPATVVGRPPMEDCYIGKATERIFLPLLRLQLPEVRDIAMPAEGVVHNLILVSIRKSYPGHARKVMSAIWGLGQAMFSKCIVVVDEDVDVQNVSEVAWRALNNIDPERDIQFTLGPVDSLDHASRLPNYGSKMGVDATRKWPGEGFTRPWPEVIRMDEDVRRRVDELWKQAGL